MKDSLKQMLDQMLENNALAKPYFKWEVYLTRHICAMLVAMEDRSIDGKRIKEVKEFVKKQVGMFSNFKDSTFMPIITLLSMEDNYKEAFGEIRVCYEVLKEKGFKHSAYLPLVAYELATVVPKAERTQVVERSYAFYQGMKFNHYWLTSADDYALALILGITSLEIEPTLEHIEACYKALSQEGFRKNNELQSLSHLMALTDQPIEIKCHHLGELRCRMKEEKCKLAYGALSLLGVLTILNPNVEQVVSEIKEAEAYLHEHKGYSGLHISRSQRNMLCTALLCKVYMKEGKEQLLKLAISNTLTALVLAQQIAIIAAASSAAAASATS